MKHVDGFCKLCQVTDTVFHCGMDSDLIDARTNRRHWPEIGWIQALLNLSELKPSQPSGILWECLKVSARRSKPYNPFLAHGLCNMQVSVYDCQEITRVPGVCIKRNKTKQ